jgi:hypothetical protein
MTTLVDSNVILDVVTDDAEWGNWSASMLASAAQQGRLVINPFIFAEVACGFERIEDLDEALPPQYFTREPLPWAAAFLPLARSCRIAVAAAAAGLRCPTSSLAPTPPWPVTPSLHATAAVTRLTFPS